VPVLAEMELTGIKVDRDDSEALSNDFARSAHRRAGKGDSHKLAGREFNIGSPKQLGEILFDEMGLDGGRKGKTGAYATGADVLEDLAAQGHDLPARVLDWRQLTKLKSTYTDALQNQINPAPAASTPPTRRPSPPPAGCPPTIPTCRTFPCAPRKGRKIRPPSSPRRPSAAERRLQPDRAAPAAHIAEVPSAEAGLPRGPGHPRHDRLAGLRHARSRAWTRWSGARPRRSTSASSTASPPSAWRSHLGIPQGEARPTSTPISSAIPASATTWK
jgi:hypothetical protein